MDEELRLTINQVVQNLKYITTTGGPRLLAAILVIVERHHLNLTEAVSLLQDSDVPKTSIQIHEFIVMADNKINALKKPDNSE